MEFTHMGSKQYLHSRAGASGLFGNPLVQSLDTNHQPTVSKGSNRPCCSSLSIRDRSQEGIGGGRGGFNILAPLRNLMTQSCFPTDFPFTGSWLAAIAATWTLRVEGDSLRSNPCCKKDSTTLIGHFRGSSL